MFENVSKFLEMWCKTSLGRQEHYILEAHYIIVDIHLCIYVYAYILLFFIHFHIVMLALHKKKTLSILYLLEYACM